MLWKILIIKPNPELVAAHKFPTIAVKLYVVGKVEIIDKSTSSYCLANLNFLLF